MVKYRVVFVLCVNNYYKKRYGIVLFELVILFVILFYFCYPISKAWDSFQSKKENSSSILKFEPQEILSICLSYFIFGLGIMWNANDVRGGIPLHKFEKNGMMSDQYAF